MAQVLVFVAMEYPGIIGIYSLNDEFQDSDGGDVTLESIHYYGGTGDAWKYLWKTRDMINADTEEMM